MLSQPLFPSPAHAAPWVSTSRTFPLVPPVPVLTLPPPTRLSASSVWAGRITTTATAANPSSLPLPSPLSVTGQAPVTVSKPKTTGTFAFPSSSPDASASIPPSIFVPSVGKPHMEPLTVLSIRRSKTLHPFNLCNLEALLCDSLLLQRYPTILSSFSLGFILGVPSLTQTFTPPNHSSLKLLASDFASIVHKEFALSRYIGPFNKATLLSLIGPFQSSPLSLVPKPNSVKYRLIQNLSFPLHASPVPSINSFIDSQDFPCTFGTFFNVCFIINNLPPGSQASTRDVADAYRTIPLHPSQWPGLVVQLETDSFAINTQNSFGLASVGGVWGQVADMLADIFRSQGIGPLTKWVDDFLFFRVPSLTVTSINRSRALLSTQLLPSQSNARKFFLGPPLPDGTQPQYDEDFQFPLQVLSSERFAYSDHHLNKISNLIGLPWKTEKTTPFSSNFTYLGFDWDLTQLTVSLNPSKQNKYLLSLNAWNLRGFHTLLEVQSLYGKLLHTTCYKPRHICGTPILFSI